MRVHIASKLAGNRFAELYGAVGIIVIKGKHDSARRYRDLRPRWEAVEFGATRLIKERA
jgi:hypothetical protein